jgi:hypothetical protein
VDGTHGGRDDRIGDRPCDGRFCLGGVPEQRRPGCGRSLRTISCMPGWPAVQDGRFGASGLTRGTEAKTTRAVAARPSRPTELTTYALRTWAASPSPASPPNTTSAAVPSLAPSPTSCPSTLAATRTGRPALEVLMILDMPGKVARFLSAAELEPARARRAQPGHDRCTMRPGPHSARQLRPGGATHSSTAVNRSTTPQPSLDSARLVVRTRTASTPSTKQQPSRLSRGAASAVRSAQYMPPRSCWTAS